MSREDFPAAHSMDTTWFAVDRDGHVGVFDSGEPGAVPTIVMESVGQHDGLEKTLAALNATSEMRIASSAFVHPGLEADAEPLPWKIAPAWPRSGEMKLLVFRDETAIPDDVRALPGVRVAREGRFVILTLAGDVELPREDPRAQLWADFVVSSHREKKSVTARTIYGAELTLGGRGVFVYAAHDARFNMPEPYGLVLAPATPLRVGDLPTAIRDELAKRPRLDVSFATTPYLQPAEMVPCTTWQSAAYLASDGFTVRPLPGREAEYGDDAGCLEDDGDERWKPVVFDPPLE